MINKITNYREYGYIQNKNFELLLQIPITEKNEERNITNWNIIVDTYHIHMKGTIERLGKPFENRGYRQQWQDRSSPGEVPGGARRARTQKPRVVAGRPGHLGSSPELQLVRPHGRRVRLCQGV